MTIRDRARSDQWLPVDLERFWNARGPRAKRRAGALLPLRSVAEESTTRGIPGASHAACEAA